MAFNIQSMVAQKAKPLPIVLLLDGSSSMRGESIEALNRAVSEMLETLKKEKSQVSEYLVTILTFSGKGVQTLCTCAGPDEIEWQPIEVEGLTPLGAALTKAAEIIEDRDLTPSRAYRPLVVLICDGLPTDDWENPFELFCSQGRTSKCDRMALSVGRSPRSMLQRFVAGTGHEVFEASQASEITKFFKCVTMTVVTRTRSKNPNLVPDEKKIMAKIERQEKSPAADDDLYDDTDEFF